MTELPFHYPSCLCCSGVPFAIENGKCEQCGYDRKWTRATKILFIMLFDPRSSSCTAINPDNPPYTSDEVKVLVIAEEHMILKEGRL